MLKRWFPTHALHFNAKCKILRLSQEIVWRKVWDLLIIYNFFRTGCGKNHQTPIFRSFNSRYKIPHIPNMFERNASKIKGFLLYSEKLTNNGFRKKIAGTKVGCNGHWCRLREKLIKQPLQFACSFTTPLKHALIDWKTQHACECLISVPVFSRGSFHKGATKTPSTTICMN